MKMMIIMMSMLMSTLFPTMKHPLSMGFILLTQTGLSCMMNGMNNYSYWFSYLLFITFIGGMMVLFIYMASIASNMKFKFSFKLLISMTIMTMMLMTMNMMDTMLMNENNMNEFINYELMAKNNNKEMLSIMKMFNMPTTMITIMLIIYLLFTMISIIKITNKKEGPLRKKN
uniref:NADH-ubiquinone oxidoreductase chain 6 n=1 Tax=Phymatostetha huangshanensis (nomen nudum) TaxID=2291524 RepID=A0A345UDI0_9HEMI|nr:NADH dehydrogenase subunit 6 [Phymatostetha huangshanensis (nomen nudum)]AXI98516.1 NADH dehydrogenase subunit 6 [Phymatostetha huangshanensis (nomen nudum)]